MGKPLLVFLAGALLAGVAGCSGGPSAEQLVEQARLQLAADDLQPATVQLKSALQKQPDSVDARFLLGQTYVRMGDGPAAEKELRRAADLGMPASEVAVPLARALLLQQKYDSVLQAAIEDLVAAPGAAPAGQAPTLKALRGHALLFTGKFDAAEVAYRDALAGDAEEREALLGLARLVAARGDFPAALERIDGLLAVAPEMADAWTLKGDILRSQDEPEAAESAYSKAIELRHDDLMDRYRRALVRVALDNVEGADQDVKRIERFAPQSPLTLYARGLVAAAREDLPAARKAFESALSRAPDAVNVMFHLGRVNFLEERYEQAREYLTRYVAAVPGNGAARLMLAVTLLNAGEFAAAEDTIRPVVAADAENVAATEVLSKSLLAQRKQDEGAEYLKKMAALRPDSPAVRAQLGVALLSMGEREAGIAALEEARRLDSEYLEADVRLAMAHLQSREFEQALKVARELQAKYPQRAVGFNLEALVRVSQGDDAAAREAFARSLAVAPADMSAHSGLAMLALKGGDRAAARTHYQAILAEDPGNLGTLINLAAVELADGDGSASAARLEEAIAAHPGVPRPRQLLAQQRMNQDDPPGVLAALDGFDVAASGDPQLLATAGWAYLKLARYGEAEAVLARAAALGRDDPWLAAALGRALVETGKPAEAMERLEAALAANPDDGTARYYLARAAIALGDGGKALAALQELRRRDPGSPRVDLLEGDLHLAQGSLAAAEAAYSRAHRAAPSNISLVRLTGVQWAQGEREKVIRALESWVGEYPQDALTLFELGNRYLIMGRDPDALATFRRFLDLSPNSALALNNVAWLSRDQDPQGALRAARRAVDLAGDWAPALDTLGVLLTQSGEFKEAQGVLERAVAVEPDNASYRLHLARAVLGQGDADGARAALAPLRERSGDFPERAEMDTLWREAGGDRAAR